MLAYRKEKRTTAPLFFSPSFLPYKGLPASCEMRRGNKFFTNGVLFLSFAPPERLPFHARVELFSPLSGKVAGILVIRAGCFAAVHSPSSLIFLNCKSFLVFCPSPHGGFS